MEGRERNKKEAASLARCPRSLALLASRDRSRREEKKKKTTRRTRHRVARHRRRQPHPARAPPRRVHRPRRQVRHVLQQLALGHPRVPHQAHVDVAAEPHPVRQRAGDAPDQGQQQGLLDVAVAEDLRGKGPGEPVVDVRGGRRGVHGGGERGVLGRGGVALLVVADARRLQERLGQQC